MTVVVELGVKNQRSTLLTVASAWSVVSGQRSRPGCLCVAQSLVAKLEVGAARSASFSSDGELIAVGLKTGEFVVLTATGLKLWGRKRDRSAPINDIR